MLDKSQTTNKLLGIYKKPDDDKISLDNFIDKTSASLVSTNNRNSD